MWGEEWATFRANALAGQQDLTEGVLFEEEIQLTIRYVEERFSELGYRVSTEKPHYLRETDYWIQHEWAALHRSVQEWRNATYMDDSPGQRLVRLQKKCTEYIRMLHTRLYKYIFDHQLWSMSNPYIHPYIGPMALDEDALEDIRAYQLEYPNPPDDPPDPRKQALLDILKKLCSDDEDYISSAEFKEMDYAELRTIVALLDDRLLALLDDVVQFAENERKPHCFVAKTLHKWMNINGRNPLTRSPLTANQKLHIRKMYKTYLAAKGQGNRTAEEEADFQQL